MSDFSSITRTPTGPPERKNMVWATHRIQSYHTEAAQRSDPPSSALKDPVFQCISKVEIICILFAFIGSDICLSPLCLVVYMLLCFSLVRQRTPGPLLQACWPPSKERQVSHDSTRR